MPEGTTAREDLVLRARSVVLAVLSAEVAVLAATGVALYFIYRPSDAGAWNEVQIAAGQKALSDWVRTAHRLAAGCSLPTALVAAALVALRSEIRRRWLGPALGVALALTTFVAWRTGFRLPWQQLALWPVTLGSNIDGYEELLGGDVRFVLRDGERSPASILGWLIVHAAVAGPGLALLLTSAWRLHLSARSASARPSITIP